MTVFQDACNFGYMHGNYLETFVVRLNYQTMLFTAKVKLFTNTIIMALLVHILLSLHGYIGLYSNQVWCNVFITD